jgi:membrane protein YdbS with pleckstrin-like domain
VTAFWYVISGIGILAAIINLSLAFARRAQPMVALARTIAAIVALSLPVTILIGKLIVHAHPPFALDWQTVFIATGAFVFAVLLLPSYVDKSEKKETLQERAERVVRPTNATVRLEKPTVGDEWVN